MSIYRRLNIGDEVYIPFAGKMGTIVFIYKCVSGREHARVKSAEGNFYDALTIEWLPWHNGNNDGHDRLKENAINAHRRMEVSHD